YKHLIDTITQTEVIPSAGLEIQGIMRGLLGMVVLLTIAVACSSNRKKIPWKTVGIGLLIQLTLAIGILRVGWVQQIFEGIGKLFVSILDFTNSGSIFLFGDLMNADSYGFIFVFQILPTIVFFASLTSLLFYLGIIQVVVKFLALALTKVLKISGAESLSVIGNIFLGQTEAPLMIKAYLERMTKSEILLVMIGGMATVAGGVLAAYIGFLGGDDPMMRLEFAKHLLAASVMAAPGAIVIAKILYPQTEKIKNEVSVSMQNIGSNALDAISNGTVEGIKLATTIGGMLLVFVAFIAMFNGVLGWIGDWTTLNDWFAANTIYDSFSLESILGIIFAPLMWIMGVPTPDIMPMGQLLGLKLAASEFVGYIQLAELKDPMNIVHLQYQKSIIMATYMLCGFANFASIGIQIGGIGSLAPRQRKVLSQFGIRALIGGTLASLISAVIAGAIIG
ncbi:MAG: nucleoside transporter C-terminal domain-containing protein, partial [Bacteroidota bacterium]|nr:nucleoside transporter C-terminal domain-containing protein [Bacteroidota bacterium]